MILFNFQQEKKPQDIVSAKCVYVCDYRAVVVPNYYLKKLDFLVLQRRHIIYNYNLLTIY